MTTALLIFAYIMALLVFFTAGRILVEMLNNLENTEEDPKL